LPWGSSIYAEIVAINLLGNSIMSLPGNGAIILTYPDAPVNFEEDLNWRSATTIGLLWSDGPSDGGSPVIDY